MLKSMTGFGAAAAEDAKRRVSVEIKTVNGRYMDLSVKAPHAFARFDDLIRKAVSAKIGRGRVDIYISAENLSADQTTVTPNIPLCAQLIGAFDQIKRELGITDANVSAEFLARFPDTFVFAKPQDDGDALWALAETALCGALAQVDIMREGEGRNISRDIAEKLDSIKRLTENIKQNAAAAFEFYERHLTEKLKALLRENFDETRVIAEAAILADKTCVDEEVTRLLSHAGQMRVFLESEGAVGRKIDFLTQEMHREAGTIASKSKTSEIISDIVNLKAEIEKIREQAQNIE